MLPKGEIVVKGGKYIGQARASARASASTAKKRIGSSTSLQKRGKGVENAGVVDA